MFKVRLPFYEMAGEIGADSASVVAEDTSSGTGSAPIPEPTSTDTTSNTSDDVGKQESFARRLKESTEKAIAEERAKWEKETADQYKDHDTHRKASEFLQKQYGINDVMTLKEQLELAELNDRAEQQNLDPETLRRIDQLEQKAARADELERERVEQQQTQQQQEQQAQWEKTYFDGLNEFLKDKGVEPDALTAFMLENEMTVNPENMTKSFDIALKAMKYDDVVRQSEEAERNGMNKFLQAKGSIPNVKGSSAQGQVTTGPAKTWAEARARAMQRL